jgi:hypothetical protein
VDELIYRENDLQWKTRDGVWTLRPTLPADPLHATSADVKKMHIAPPPGVCPHPDGRWRIEDMAWTTPNGRWALYRTRRTA